MNNDSDFIQKRKALKIIYISSYIPEKCGIATFTKDLTNAINLLNPYALSEILATVKPDQELEYPWEVKFKINRDDLNSYLQAAEYINQSGADLVVLEHEFGIFGGPQGEFIVPLIEALTKPLVVTCHTVIEDTESDYGLLLKRIIKRANAITVMMEHSAQKLISDYQVPSKKIAVIPHGTPDLPFGGVEKAKKKKRLSNKIILGNINLLTEAKGLEYTIEAVAKVAQKYPQILYLAIGQTHPVLLKNKGEAYRNSLKKKIRQLGIQKNVKFINRYVSLDELLDWLKVMDFYVTPYLDPQQASSGALAYAIGAGKCCISTPYIYAKEALSDGRGVLVPFKDPSAIADSIISLWENKEEMDQMRRKAYSYGRLMTWHSVALQYLDLFKAVLKQKETAQ